MAKVKTLSPIAMSSHPPQTKKRRAPKDTKEDLVGKYENEAVRIFRSYLDGKERDPSSEVKFIAAVKKSPSVRTVDFGIMLAIEVGWHAALKELFAVDLSSYKPIQSESYYRHPLQDEAFSRLDLPPAASSKSRGAYVNATLMYAVLSGKIDTVRVLAEYMDMNINDFSGEPLLHYVYLLKQQTVRKQILDIVLPKLDPSVTNLFTAAKQGDLKSTKYIVERMEPEDRNCAVIAGRFAIQNGHDSIAKWMVETPGLVDWDLDGSSLVDVAIERNNLDMVKYLAKHSPALLLHQLGYDTASDLWEFLQKKHCPELFGKFVPSHPEGYSGWA